MHNWVVRTDTNVLKNVILPSLEAGELRQGWGYRDDQDLNIIGPIVAEHGRGALNADQRATWRRVQRFWPEHWDPVRVGDRILLPKVPGSRRWRLVEVTGPYRFSRHPESGDHGHILPVRTLVPDISNTNKATGAGLQRTMRNRSPMWNIDRRSDELDRLVAAGASAATVDGPTDRLQDLLDETLANLLQGLRERFRANQLEDPVRRLLEVMFADTAVVEDHTGAGEHGADFIVRENDRFGHERVTVIQLKDHDPLNDQGALRQIEEAFNWWSPVSAAVILTTARSEDPAFAEARAELQDRLGIPVTAVLGAELAQWMLDNLQSLLAD